MVKILKHWAAIEDLLFSFTNTRNLVKQDTLFCPKHTSHVNSSYSICWVLLHMLLFCSGHILFTQTVWLNPPKTFSLKKKNKWERNVTKIIYSFTIFLFRSYNLICIGNNQKKYLFLLTISENLNSEQLLQPI